MPSPTRRDLLRGSAAALAATAAAPYARAARIPGRNDRLKVGLIGCGGRGTGAAHNALMADPDTVLWAMADAFADQVEWSHGVLANHEEVKERVDVPPERRFAGFEAYQEVIDSCDVILLATPPHFRPLHMEAAVAANKHMFVEKPVATDGPGVRRVMEASKEAKRKGLVMVSGLCYRYQFAKQETVQRIHDGAIGDIVGMQTTYNTGGLWHRGHGEDWSDMEYQMRNWYYFTWLGGDHIVEQHIHSLDKLAWVMNDEYPAKATASGGRAQRTEDQWGHIFDHFNTVYEWADGVRGFSSCRQWNGAASDVSDWIFGSRGKANVQSHRIETTGGWKWRYRGDGPDDMYQNEHDVLFAAIRNGEVINDGDHMCKSTLMAIMGRMAAYTGQTITWEDAWNSQEDLTPAAYAWGAAPEVSVAIPGVTKFI